MPTISIHLTESEYNLVRQHIENKGLTISQYIKATLLEEIEDEYDATIVNAYVQEKDSMEFLTFEEAYKEWDFTHFFGFYNIFWGDSKSHSPKVYFFMHKNRHIIQFALQYKNNTNKKSLKYMPTLDYIKF